MLNKRPFKFNAWIPAIETMLTGVAVYDSGLIGYDHEALVNALNQNYVLDDNTVYEAKNYGTDNQVKVLELMSADDWFFIDEKDYHLMQYIGIKGFTGDYADRHNNEVELYEGHIVVAKSQGSTGKFIIAYRREAAPTFMLYPAWQGGNQMWSIHGSDLGRKKGDYYDDLQVIGNVFENPELAPVKDVIVQ